MKRLSGAHELQGPAETSSSEPARIALLVFDLWETLAAKSFSLSESLRHQFQIPRTKTYLRRYEESIQTRRWASHQELAVSFLEEFRCPVHKKSIATVVDLVRAAASSAKAIPGAQQLLAEISARYKVAILSNTTSFESGRTEQLGLSQYFCREVYSWQTGLLKPDPQAFLNACRILGINPSEGVYIDTNRPIVEAAITTGMYGVWFSSFKSLRYTLLQRFDVQVKLLEG